MNTSEKLKGILKEWADDYKKTCEESRAEYIKTLTPGGYTQVPREGIIYGDNNKEAFSDRCTGYSAKAKAIIDTELLDISRQYDKPIPADALQTCQLLALKKGTEPGDYTRALNKYKNVPEVYETIRGIAVSNGVKALPVHDLKHRAAALEELKNRFIFSITPKRAEQGETSEAHLAIAGAIIDDALK